MPKLILAVACRNALVENESHHLSLIQIWTSLNINVMPESGFNASSMAPFGWAFVTHWEREEADVDKAFEQDLKLVAPNGTILFNEKTEFALPIEETYTLTARGDAFPVGQSGRYVFVVNYREIGDENPWLSLAEWSITIKHNVISSSEY